jgi:hypothetical protein
MSGRYSLRPEHFGVRVAARWERNPWREYAYRTEADGSTKTLTEAARAKRTGGNDCSHVIADMITLARNTPHRQWYWLDGFKAWVAAPAPGVKVGKRTAYDLPCPCPQHVYGDGGFSPGGACMRPIARDGKCGLHAAAAERREAARDERRRVNDERDDRTRRAQATAADIDELWSMACEVLDITRTAPVMAHYSDSPSVVVDAEALRPMLMRLIDTA